ncbi:flavodoxin family protein [Pseudobutyrivibrio xylanivorans]|uniref:Flavodoxin n=1 Tax=Pseudobutyrivibrio xylanivorans TaxID=185007 RepID=A0A1G5S1N6_PSEXY|nr:flavodoxin [Pseudobutyrivibrio xylanivorans]SCZ79641.1 Flavodoxin [Pseudobutyrivibrio xylanivorans]
MKTLIVYYSHEGNTDFVAKKIADKICADTLRLVPVKKYPEKGFAKFFWGGKSAVMAETPELEPYSVDLDSYEQIVFGFPVWASNITPPLRTFVKENPSIKEKKIAAFACQSGKGAENAFEKLKDSIGIVTLTSTLILIDPKDKPSDDNDRKIEEFCKEIKKW